jgi:hypothetical protein
MLASVLGGCMTVPTLEHDGVGISDIVQRVKCELAFAIPEFKGKFPSGEFQWLYYWTAKVDLELQTTNTASLGVGTNYTDTVSGGLFTFGAGGGVSGTAFRNDKISFTLSVNELADTRRSRECGLPHRLGLLGNLGLEEWLKSALTPVENKQLTIGFHQSPTGKTVKIPGPTVPFAAMPKLDMAVRVLKHAETLIETARDTALDANKKALKKQLQATYQAVETAYAYAGRAVDEIEEASVLAWEAKRELLDSKPGSGVLEPADEKRLNAFAARAKDAMEQAKQARDRATHAWNLLPRDPPLDSIAHSVRFTLAAGANATPNWSLVYFRGPGLSPPFANAQRTRVHNLDVVLGAPAEAGGKELSDEQRRQLLNLRLDALRFLIVPTQ